MNRHVRLVPGAVVAQGDNSPIDARVYQVNNTVNVTVEDRAQILAEVGRALKPVLGQLVARLEDLERQNRVLLDTVESIVAAGPALAEHPLAAIAPGALVDVGNQLDDEPHADPSSRQPNGQRPSNRPPGR